QLPITRLLTNFSPLLYVGQTITPPPFFPANDFEGRRIRIWPTLFCFGTPTLHSSLFTLHPSLFTLHSSLFTLHSSLFTLHSSLFTLHSSLFTLHSSLFTISLN